MKVSFARVEARRATYTVCKNGSLQYVKLQNFSNQVIYVVHMKIYARGIETRKKHAAMNAYDHYVYPP